MICYFDTSALVKLYSDEDGSDKVRELVMNPSNENYILELAFIELLGKNLVFARWMHCILRDG